MNWSDEQKHVIDVRNKNVLVAAAAGSGKTATLVGRLLEMLREGKNIDSFLIVTFTNAAAAEMKAKIAENIGKAVEEEPDNIHMQKQLTLVQTAQIMTIDSFCLNVVRNYFYMIDLDPSFRIADETELKLLESDVLAEVLESYYEGQDGDYEAFIEMIECYGNKRSDKPVEDIILKLYKAAMSFPWPYEWLDKAAEKMDINDIGDIENSVFIKDIVMSDIKLLLKDAEVLLNEMNIIMNLEKGPLIYKEAWNSDGELIDELLLVNRFSKYYEIFDNLKFKALSNKKSDADKELKEKYQSVRAAFKKILEDIKKNYFYEEPEFMAEDIKKTIRPVKELIKVTKSFMEKFALKKTSKNIIDFNDMEHFALRILIDRTDGIDKPTQAAYEYRKIFEEIIIDEYQDSNLVQETILNSISRHFEGRNNIFMVGDVKQSIYKFRLAKPELFMEKYKSYGGSDDLYNEKIDLNANFRSRKKILDSVNAVFYMIMNESFGGIEYDENASLKQNEGYEDYPEDGGDCTTELILIDDGMGEKTETSKSEEIKTSQSEQIKTSQSEQIKTSQSEVLIDKDEDLQKADAEEYSKAELEAIIAAGRIKELVEGDFCVHDKEGKEFVKRKVQYKDIVILLRSLQGYSEVFSRVLKNMGIPVSVQSKTGYFEAYEVRTIINMLKIIDNPNQDIAFAGVLYSDIVGLYSEEMAEIKVFAGSYSDKRIRNYYTASREYSEIGTNEKLKEKLKEFFKIYDKLRSISKRVPVKELISEIYSETGFLYKVMSMSGGSMRKLNLDMLVKKAESYAKTSYHGLFHFIRYIERIIKYDIDFGDAKGIAENIDAVSIMSIHKSKGLEFPVVILSGMGRNFNSSDLKETVIIHPEYGIAAECIDTKTRTKTPTIIKKAVKRFISLENRTEELRILYVAMTRAKEKLIMTGCVKNLERCMEKWQSFPVIKDKNKTTYSYNILSDAKNYLDFTVRACLENTELFKVIIPSEKDLDIISEEEFLERTLLYEKMINGEPAAEITDEEEYTKFLEGMEFKYLYENEGKIPAKFSVSELKKESMSDEEQEELIEKAEAEPLVPEFIKRLKGEEKVKEEVYASGGERGTAYHRFMECCNFKIIPISSERSKVLSAVKNEAERMINSKLIKEEAAKLINLYKVTAFFMSDIGKRMIAADKEGNLFKEQRFMMGVPAEEISNEYDSRELVIIQGIIDAYFCENEKVILIDYKTDGIGEEGELITKYKKQIELYADALSRLNKNKCSEKILYSFKLEKEIKVD